jgi:hypothetical protein
MFLRYVVDEELNQFSNDVPPLHAHVEVCSQASHRPKPGRLSEVINRDLGATGYTLPLRRPFSALDTAHHFTTSTRIPLLSP